MRQLPAPESRCMWLQSSLSKGRMGGRLSCRYRARASAAYENHSAAHARYGCRSAARSCPFHFGDCTARRTFASCTTAAPVLAHSAAGEQRRHTGTGRRRLTQAEVGSLADAEAVAEARVVGPREGDDDVTGGLQRPHYLHTCRRVDEADMGN